ncbi:hypothetical protein [Deinococcus sp. QL22]|uniref:hypothetical protein n=1 Tax=Deinococcus sp. QL22 TaxID=2939437 RepID=UPI002017DB5C|nr:hypothetical protein [Deinococcus sp. QL22]UQN06309.1 hypothetical protein M1R55_15840 [Deinococcus sp. QL22]
MTNGAKRARVIRVAGPGPAVREFISERNKQQAARAYAEQWYQSLRAWKLVFGEAAVMSVSYAAFRNSGGDGISTLGEGGTPSPTTLITPMGEVGEGETGRTITTLEYAGTPDAARLGRRLKAIRGGTSMATLVDERGGWASPKERAMEYAVAVLTLAVRLRDPHAEIHLFHLQKSVD